MILNDFAIVLNEQQFNKLERILACNTQYITPLRCKSVNDLISFFIRLSLPFFFLIHFGMLIGNGYYQRINWSKKLHIVITRQEYNFLKLIHANLETYGMAVVVRTLIDLVFRFFDAHGEGWLVAFQEYLENIEKVLSQKKCWFKSRTQFPDLFHYRIDYNKNFSVIRILTG